MGLSRDGVVSIDLAVLFSTDIDIFNDIGQVLVLVVMADAS